MENLLSLDTLETTDFVKKKLFTKIQLSTLKKKLLKKQLNSNEKTYYYKFIKPKIKAMMTFFNIHENNINGEEYILKERLKEATELIKKVEKRYKHKKILISGSFLFSKKYNDIDIFIFTKYKKNDYIKGKIHITFLQESALSSIFFNSLSQISVSNFAHTQKTEFNINIKDVLQTYELLINSILNKEEYGKLLRDFILQTEVISKEVVLNPKQLFDIKAKMKHKNVNVLSNILVNALNLTYNKNLLKKTLQTHIKDYRKLLQEYTAAKNLGIYIDTYLEAINLAK